MAAFYLEAILWFPYKDFIHSTFDIHDYPDDLRNVYDDPDWPHSGCGTDLSSFPSSTGTDDNEDLGNSIYRDLESIVHYIISTVLADTDFRWLVRIQTPSQRRSYHRHCCCSRRVRSLFGVGFLRQASQKPRKPDDAYGRRGLRW